MNPGSELIHGVYGTLDFLRHAQRCSAWTPFLALTYWLLSLAAFQIRVNNAIRHPMQWAYLVNTTLFGILSNSVNISCEHQQQFRAWIKRLYKTGWKVKWNRIVLIFLAWKAPFVFYSPPKSCVLSAQVEQCQSESTSEKLLGLIPAAKILLSYCKSFYIHEEEEKKKKKQPTHQDINLYYVCILNPGHAENGKGQTLVILKDWHVRLFISVGDVNGSHYIWMRGEKNFCVCQREARACLKRSTCSLANISLAKRTWPRSRRRADSWWCNVRRDPVTKYRTGNVQKCTLHSHCCRYSALALLWYIVRFNITATPLHTCIYHMYLYRFF